MIGLRGQHLTGRILSEGQQEVEYSRGLLWFRIWRGFSSRGEEAATSVLAHFQSGGGAVTVFP